MANILGLIAALDDIKNTPSGTVEYDNNSLQTVLEIVLDLIKERGSLLLGNLSQLQAIDAMEGSIAIVKGEGVFYREAAGTANPPFSYPASGEIGRAHV